MASRPSRESCRVLATSDYRRSRARLCMARNFEAGVHRLRASPAFAGSPGNRAAADVCVPAPPFAPPRATIVTDRARLMGLLTMSSIDAKSFTWDDEDRDLESPRFPLAWTLVFAFLAAD